jgi:hypothetical protein
LQIFILKSLLKIFNFISAKSNSLFPLSFISLSPEKEEFFFVQYHFLGCITYVAQTVAHPGRFKAAPNSDANGGSSSELAADLKGVRPDIFSFLFFHK